MEKTHRVRRKGHEFRRGQTLRVEERRIRVLELRTAGKPFETIARELGTSRETVRLDYRAAIQERVEVRREMADTIIEQALERYDRYLSALDAKVQRGDTRAIECARKVERDRLTVLGLGPPRRVEMSGPSGSPIQVRYDLSRLTDEQLEVLAAAVAAVSAGGAPPDHGGDPGGAGAPAEAPEPVA